MLVVGDDPVRSTAVVRAVRALGRAGRGRGAVECASADQPDELVGARVEFVDAVVGAVAQVVATGGVVDPSDVVEGRILRRFVDRDVGRWSGV
jgi:hypothetical protein